MVTGNVENGIAVTYDDVEGKLNFAVGGIVPRSHGGYTSVRSQNANCSSRLYG